MESIALKILKGDLPKQADAVLGEEAPLAERWASRVRLAFAIIFAAAAYRSWDDPTSRKYIFLGLAVCWLAALVLVHLRMRRGTSESLVTLTTLADFTIVNVGLLFFVWQHPNTSPGAGLFFCYFPLLAVTALRYRAVLVIIAGLYAGLFYTLAALIGIGNPWFRVAMLGLTTVICAIGSRRPKGLMISIASRAVQDAFNIGAKQRELEMNSLFHEAVFPPAIIDLPQIWCSSKHAPGVQSGGDYYHVFETRQGPLVVVGDLSGDGIEIVRDVERLHQHLTGIVILESSLTGILDQLNAYTWQEGKGKHRFTCFLSRWEGESMEYVNAGHLPAIHLNKERRSQLPPTCRSVGEVEDTLFVAQTIAFPARDLLLIYTDGLTGRLGDNRESAVAEIEALAERFSHGEVNTLCHRVFECAQPGVEEPKDDSTLVVIRRQPKVAEESKMQAHADSGD